MTTVSSTSHKLNFAQYTFNCTYIFALILNRKIKYNPRQTKRCVFEQTISLFVRSCFIFVKAEKPKKGSKLTKKKTRNTVETGIITVILFRLRNEN